ncbi:MAG TPA: hypothetical protein VIV60_35965, partial [Polyangiaceae bacterium]
MRDVTAKASPAKASRGGGVDATLRGGDGGDASEAAPSSVRGARHLRASTDAGLVQAGIRDFEQRISACLGRLPAATDAERSEFAVIQRRLAVDTLRRSVTAMVESGQRDLLTRFRLFDDEFCRSESTESAAAGRKKPSALASKTIAAPLVENSGAIARGASRSHASTAGKRANAVAGPLDGTQAQPEELG